MNGASREAISGASPAGDSESTSSRVGRSRRDLLRKAAKTGFAVTDLLGRRMQGPKILIYHEIEEVPRLQMCVSPGAFAQHLDWLLSEGSVTSLQSAVSDLNADNGEQFVITFDDGYRGVYKYAYPLLMERKVPFTLYISTGIVSETARRTVNGLETLNWSEVAEMVESGFVTIGAHTDSHPDLRRVPRSRIVEELDTSNRIIAERTDIEPRHFAYPKGYWSEDAEPLVVERYDTAVLGAGPAITAGTDKFRLSRVPIQRADGYFFFKRKLQRGLILEEWVRSRIKNYQNPNTINPIGLSR